MPKIYLGTKTVAWQIPPGPIAKLYDERYYLPPEGWGVITCRWPDWVQGEFGEMRKIDGKGEPC